MSREDSSPQSRRVRRDFFFHHSPLRSPCLCVEFLFGQFQTLLLYRDQLAIAMLDRLTSEFHSCLSGENEAVAENVRAR